MKYKSRFILRVRLLISTFQKCMCMSALHHCRKLMQIRCQKGVGTIMHKCFVGKIVTPIQRKFLKNSMKCNI